MTVSIGLGRVGSNFLLVVGWLSWVNQPIDWVGRVTQNGPMNNSGQPIQFLAETVVKSY